MADHNENLKDTLNEEIEHADQKPAEEHYSLNDDRRVKVLSPGMLVAKRFFRNRLAVTGMAILVFMFVFSFIGGLISPYEQDKFFYADKTIRREFAAVIKNTEFRYSSADDSVFGLPAQAQAMLAIQQQKDGFTYRDNRFTLTKEAEDFYSVSVNGQVVGLAYKSVVSPSASDATLSFEFTYQALKAYLTDGADTFTADGKTYTVDESGSVMDGTTEVAYVSPYVVQALMPDVFLSRDFKDKLIDTINAGGEKFTYTDESLIVDEEPATDEEDGTNSAITPDDSQMPDDTPQSATAEYDISFDAATNSWSVLQEQTSRQYDKYSAPSKEHLMGTDGYGMDMLTRLMYGGRVSLMIGFIVIVIETVIGVIFGGIAGYFGGWVDNLIMRVVDIFYCIPSMPIIIILGAAMDAQRVDGWLRMIYLMLILGFLGWAGIARLVRGQILSLREQEFMTATEACGISVSRRIFKHLIPNVIPQLHHGSWLRDHHRGHPVLPWLGREVPLRFLGQHYQRRERHPRADQLLVGVDPRRSAASADGSGLQSGRRWSAGCVRPEDEALRKEEPVCLRRMRPAICPLRNPGASPVRTAASQISWKSAISARMCRSPSI